MEHPYKSQPPRAFWDRSVATAFDATALVSAREPLIRPGEKLASAGSCFAANMVPYLEAHGVPYVRTEATNPALEGVDVEAYGYAKFSAAYGNIYTPRQLLQLISRAKGEFLPIEDRWRTERGIVDPFRPGLKFIARTDKEFEALRAQHFRRTLEAFSEADVFVFTLGLTEA